MTEMWSLLLLVTCVATLSLASLESASNDEVTVLVEFNYDDEEVDHSRVKRGWRSKLRDLLKNTFRDKNPVAPSSVNLNLKTLTGQEVALQLHKKKSITPKIDMWGMQNGVPVKQAAPENPTDFSLFSDDSGQTSAVLLMSCINGDCTYASTIYHETQVYSVEPASSNPYASTGRKINLKGRKVLNDERVLGLSSNGESLGVPVNSRRKRDLVLDEKMIQTLIKKKRKKRQAGTKNVVELVMLTDFSEYDYWYKRSGNDSVAAKSALQLYYIMLTNMMDLRFKNILSQTGGSIDITFMVNAIIFSETAEDSPWSEGNKQTITTSDGEVTVVNIDSMLDDLTKWAWANSQTLPSRDHIMAVTKLNTASYKDGNWNTDTLGVAWTGGMCSAGYSISIIEDPGIGLIDFAATHEIAHNMNSNHDTVNCDDNDFNIMAAVGGAPSEGLAGTGKESNPWEFSSCSLASIIGFVEDQLGSSSCLSPGMSSYDDTNYESYKSFFAPGVYLPVDTQCTLTYGDGSRRCYTLDASICSDGAWCWNPNDPTYCYLLYVREGTLCGDSMRCHLGGCTNSSVVMATCPPSLDSAGEEPVVIAIGGGGAITTTAAPTSGAAAATTLAAVTVSADSSKLIC